jgi:4a-hydroxytetrahydrobiopterin dehydratase
MTEEEPAMRHPTLSESEVLDALSTEGAGQWRLLGGKLIKSVTLPSFADALSYVGEVGRLAEAADHHPDIDIRYDTVTLALVTHDSDGITRLDLDLARAIDGIDAARG